MGDFTPYEKVKTLCISGLQNHPSQTLCGRYTRGIFSRLSATPEAGLLYRYTSPKAPIYIIDPTDIPVLDSRIIHILSRLSATAEAAMKRSGIGRPGAAGVIRGHRNGGFLGDGAIIKTPG